LPAHRPTPLPREQPSPGRAALLRHPFSLPTASLVRTISQSVPKDSPASGAQHRRSRHWRTGTAGASWTRPTQSSLRPGKSVSRRVRRTNQGNDPLRLSLTLTHCGQVRLTPVPPAFHPSKVHVHGDTVEFRCHDTHSLRNLACVTDHRIVRELPNDRPETKRDDHPHWPLCIIQRHFPVPLPCYDLLDVTFIHWIQLLNFK
jgi:hypothetical protein